MNDAHPRRVYLGLQSQEGQSPGWQGAGMAPKLEARGLYVEQQAGSRECKPELCKVLKSQSLPHTSSLKLLSLKSTHTAPAGVQVFKCSKLREAFIIQTTAIQCLTHLFLRVSVA